MALAQRAIEVLERKYEPHGFNVGFNQGRVAGAGVEHHIHMHVVPRWGGDTNFMPVLADTRVMPQTLEQTYEASKGEFLTRRQAARSSRRTTSAASTARTWTARPRTSSGAAFARVLADLREKPTSELRVGLGRDMRIQAPEMAGRLARRASSTRAATSSTPAWSAPRCSISSSARASSTAARW